MVGEHPRLGRRKKQPRQGLMQMGTWYHQECAALRVKSPCKVSQVIQEVRQSKRRVTLVAPFWPCRPYMMGIPVILPDIPHPLSQRRGTLMHRYIIDSNQLPRSCQSSITQKGFSEAVASMAANTRRGSTMATNYSRLRKFGEQCHIRQILLAKISVTEVCNFLQKLFEEEKQAATIKKYRLAIAAIHEGFRDSSSLGTNRYIAQ